MPGFDAIVKYVDHAAETIVGSDPEMDTHDPLAWETREAGFSMWKHCIAGSAAGVMEHVAMYPVDTVKTRMQAAPVDPSMTKKFISVRQTVNAILKEGGWGSLFRGCTAIGGACIPAHVGLFSTYEWSKYHLLDSGPEKEHKPLRAAICGALSTIVHDSIIVPMDVVKQRLQLGCYKSTYHCVVTIAQSEGVGAFYRSLPATLLMECPFYAILVACNESLKVTMEIENTTLISCIGGKRSESWRDNIHESSKLDCPHQKNLNASRHVGWHFASAGLSGMVASACTQPLDVVKTRLQTQEILREQGSHHSHEVGVVRVAYRGLLPTCMRVLSEEGVIGLFRGTLPRMVFAAPSAAMCWGTYEMVKAMLKDV